MNRIEGQPKSRTSEYAKFLKEKNPEFKKRQQSNSREYSRRNRRKILETMGGKCTRCGETDWRCLQIDHINGGGCRYSKTHNGRTVYNNAIAGYIIEHTEEYQLLCANCNWKKRYENNENGHGGRLN